MVSLISYLIPISCLLNPGDEVYERLEIQTRVNKVFKMFHNDDNWVVISAPQGSEQTMEAVTMKICEHLKTFLATAGAPGLSHLPLQNIQ